MFILKPANLLIIIFCLIPSSVFPQTVPRVIVLPFEILSQARGAYLRTEIPKAIRNQLKQDGAVVLDAGVIPDALWKEKNRIAEGVRKIGIRTGADYVIWGSLTWIGKKFSLDAKMTESLGKGRPHFFFKEGMGIENLLGSVKELSREIGLKIFKREKVSSVLVQGNQRIEVDAILKQIKTKPGDVYLAKSLSQDLKAVYAMGYFDDIRIEAEDGPQGKTIIFKVKEKPTIRIIRVSNNKVYTDEEIIAALSLKTGSILNIFQIQNNVERIKVLYKEKNYHNIKVSYEIHQTKQNQGDIEFIVEEGSKLRIKKITFIGNKAYPAKKLKGLMETSEKGFFYWISDSGNLNMDDLNQDGAKIAALYHNNGVIEAKVGDPQVEFKDSWIEVKIKIEEGLQFKVGNVDVAGDLIFPLEELKAKLNILKEKFFNREILRKDILALTDLYGNAGFAYANITPLIKTNLKELTVNITYQVEKGKKVYFEMIIIGGNTKTRDKVIRRQLKVYEQGLYNGELLKKGVRSLYRLDYFEDIKVNTAKGSSDDKMILKIDVTEKPTGSFSFGGGYSTVENFFIQGSILQKNLFGRGQILQLKASIGGRSTRFTISFTEPWFFDIPLSAGFDLYNWEYDYDTYVKESNGGRLRLSYRIFDFTRVHFTYTFDRADIKDVDKNASDDIKALEGVNMTSSIYTGLSYDSRDKVFNPTKGSEHRLGIEYAGLGGDIGFTKLVGETGWYIPLVWKFIGFAHGKAGWVTENSGKILPDYEKFYLGGINSLRGFDFQDISLIDENGAKIGGDKMIQFNFELIFPLLEKQGLVGLVFFDTGNVYGQDDNIDIGNLRKSAGYGIRWYSPMGPMRLEYGYILDPQPGEDADGRWEFSMGGAF
jgi:outer membrane protein insertion porin family